MNKLVKDALILTAITVVAGCLLGLFNEITKDPIAKANEKATQEAYAAVFADATFEAVDGFDADAATAVIAAEYPDDKIDNCVVAKDASGNAAGYVMTVTTTAGYGGAITFSVGITNDGNINGYSITDIAESPGLGMNAKEPKFADQFKNKAAQIFEVTKTGATADNQIDAISGATITSKAVTNGVNAAVAYFNSLGGAK